MIFRTKLFGLATVAVVGLAVLKITAPNGITTSVIQPAQAQPSATTVTAAGITLHSVHFELPASDQTFSGPDAEAINNNCLACHSAGMVLQQPALSRTAWQGEVEKMRGQFKAPVSEEDVPAIVAWLAAHKGTP